MLDIHSHILPLVDDGSTSMQMTHDMLKEAKLAGVNGIIASPHFRSRKTNRQRILQVFAEVQKVADEYGIQMRLGFEVHYSMLVHMEMPSITDWCIQGTKYLLLEFSNAACPVDWDVMVCDLVHNGYQPIIVHPERYIFIQNSPNKAIELKRYGCELQVDAMSLKNRFSFGNNDAKTAHKLLRLGIVDYISSDAHRPEYYRQLNRVHKRLGQRWPEKGFLHEMLSV